MNLVRALQPNRRKQKGQGEASAGGREFSRQTQPSTPKRQERQITRHGGPKLSRCNAFRNLDYDVWASGSAGGGGEGRLTRSLDIQPASASPSPLVHFASQTSFRISGEVEGEFDLVCRSLGLSGPDDFAITPADWAAASRTCFSDAIFGSDKPRDSGSGDSLETPLEEQQLPLPPPQQEAQEDDGSDAMVDGFHLEVATSNTVPEPVSRSPITMDVVSRGNNKGGGIKGPRPSALAPPPPMSLPLMNMVGSTWDIFRSLAPDDGHKSCGAAYQWREGFPELLEDVDSEEEGDGDSLGGDAELENEKGLRMGVTATDLTASCSFWTSNDDDSSSTTTDGISPIGKARRNIVSWTKGQLLGSGSFGAVYEAMSDDGFFFAVKEVSLLGEGTNAKQCIHQLEQEIALLSQFEHENIVQYLGTAKEEAKICIFLELVSQGSLVSLYQKYHLRDSQVSAYTRQILNGLKYLHDRNVVHRDIKCANILVDTNGSVKLADFGLAKEITKFNDVKSSKGSVYWMAPEVIKARRTYGPSADIWSLGCTVLEMLTRQHPFPDLEWTQALFFIGRGGRPPIPDSLSRDAHDFIEQCTQVDPDKRPYASKLLDHPFVKRLLPASGPDSSTHRLRQTDMGENVVGASCMIR